VKEYLDDMDTEEDELEDILTIVTLLLKEVSKLKTSCIVKAVMSLSAVMHYVKLQAQYQEHPTCKQPAMKASLATARSMGKGPYFMCCYDQMIRLFQNLSHDYFI
jgi:hypothetical protein